MSNWRKYLGYFRRPIRLADFESIVNFWEERYESGGNSGAGSYGLPAIHKAEFVNSVIKKFDIKSLIDFGCGDGHQLSLLQLDGCSYLGLDISKTSIKICNEKFDVPNITFLHVSNYDSLNLPYCDLALSMDVIYHLTDNNTYFTYLENLFKSSKFILIYSMDFDNPNWNGHVRPRNFTMDIMKIFPNVQLISQTESTIAQEKDMKYFLYKN